LADLSTRQLVATLADSNGWIRDKCQQLLIWRADKSCVDPLRQLARGSDVPLARLHAICTLEGLHGLDESTLLAVLQDNHAGVRRQAIRLAEDHRSPQVLESLLPFVADDDAKLRLQLACSLGEFHDPRIGAALARLLTDARSDVYIQAGAMSSISRENVSAVLSNLLSSRELNQDVLRGLVRIAAKSSDQAALATVVESIVNGRKENKPLRWQFEALAALLDVRPLSESAKLAENEQIAAIMALASSTAVDGTLAESLRTTAIQLIAREPKLADSTVAAAGQLLAPQQSPPIQAAMVSRLSNRSEPSVAVELLKRWRNYSPTLRGQIMNVLLSREPWTAILLDAIESQDVLAADFDAATRQRLLTLKQADLRARAEKLLAASSTSDRQAAMEEYAAALRMPADIVAGQKVFAAKCASCHRLGDVGKNIGPNLASLTDKSPAAFFTSILDPNRAVEAKYLSYTVADTDGRVQSGLIKTETATSITLVTSEAKEVSILRSEIEDLNSSGRSLMPDGLEKEVSLQDVANLLGYLQSVK
jgi:putative heme-binding domain-containing protein